MSTLVFPMSTRCIQLVYPSQEVPSAQTTKDWKLNWRTLLGVPQHAATPDQ